MFGLPPFGYLRPGLLAYRLFGYLRPDFPVGSMPVSPAGSQDPRTHKSGMRRPQGRKTRGRANSIPDETRHDRKGVVGRGGLEPPTSRLSGVRSNHMSYRPRTGRRA